MGRHKQDTDGQAEAQDTERYRQLQQEGHHTLPYKEFLRAKELGIELPEADPVYEIGSGRKCPLPIPMAKDFPLERCYRVTEELIEMTDFSGRDNAHILAALGRLKEPFVPVWIDEVYDGYSWTRLATVDDIDVTSGQTLLDSWFREGLGLECVDSLAITVHTSDDKTHSGNVCLAVSGVSACCPGSSQTLYLTPEARTHLDSATWLHYLGEADVDELVAAVTNSGKNDCVTAMAKLLVKLEDFWLACNSDAREMRLALIDHLQMLVGGWRSITRTEGEAVRIKGESGREVILRPNLKRPYVVDSRE